MANEQFISRWGLEDESDKRWIPIPGFIVKNWSNFVTIQEWAFIIQVMSFKFDSVNGQARPSLQTIADEIGYTIRSVQRFKSSLVEKGMLLITERPGKPHIYNFAPFSKSCKQAESTPDTDDTPDSPDTPRGDKVVMGGGDSSDTQRTRIQDQETQEEEKNTSSLSGEEISLISLLALALENQETDPEPRNAISQAEDHLASVEETKSETPPTNEKEKSSGKKEKEAATIDCKMDANVDAIESAAIDDNTDSPTDESADDENPCVEAAEECQMSKRDLNDRYQEITARAFNLRPGPMTGKLVKFFRGQCTFSKSGNETEYTSHQPDDGWTPEQIGGLFIWYWSTPRYGGRSGISEEERYLPRTVRILRDRMDEFLSLPNYDKYIANARERLDRIMAGEEVSQRPDGKDDYFDQFATDESRYTPDRSEEELEEQRQIREAWEEARKKEKQTLEPEAI